MMKYIYTVWAGKIIPEKRVCFDSKFRISRFAGVKFKKPREKDAHFGGDSHSQN